MPTLVWDQPEDRTYETGLDRGVLYLPDGSGVVWNGLVSVIEKFDKTTAPVYFDGMKINDLVTLGDFSATMKAVTYPDEFVAVEGSADLRKGVSFEDQKPQVFGLCYRTSFGDDDAGNSTGYKLHILYNVTAIPHEKTYASASNTPSLVEFEWDIVAVPEETPGFRPTAHLVIDSRDVDPLLLSDLENQLYGTSAVNAALIPMSDLVSFLQNWYRIKITDNGDGTWSADVNPDIISVLSWSDAPFDSLFVLAGANAVFSADGTQYTLSDTTDSSDIHEISIKFNPDGSWSATSDSDLLVPPETLDGEFQIFNANAIFLDPDTYQISDTGIND